MNWNKELDKLSDILKEEKNVNTCIPSKDNDGIRNSSIDNIPVRITNQLTKNKGGEHKMITVEAALGDLDKIAKSEVDATTKIIEAVKVLVKMLSTIRSNQLLCDEDKAKIREAKTKRETEKK